MARSKSTRNRTARWLEIGTSTECDRARILDLPIDVRQGIVRPDDASGKPAEDAGRWTTPHVVIVKPAERRLRCREVSASGCPHPLGSSGGDRRAPDRIRHDDTTGPAGLLGHQGLVDPAAILRPGAQAQAAIGAGDNARIAQRVRNRHARRAAIPTMKPVLSQRDTIRARRRRNGNMLAAPASRALADDYGLNARFRIGSGGYSVGRTGSQ